MWLTGIGFIKTTRATRVGVELVESKTPLCPISLNSAVDILAKNNTLKRQNLAV
jgi:hypothetical protein